VRAPRQWLAKAIDAIDVGLGSRIDKRATLGRQARRGILNMNMNRISPPVCREDQTPDLVIPEGSLWIFCPGQPSRRRNFASRGRERNYWRTQAADTIGTAFFHPLASWLYDQRGRRESHLPAFPRPLGQDLVKPDAERLDPLDGPVLALYLPAFRTAFFEPPSRVT